MLVAVGVSNLAALLDRWGSVSSHALDTSLRSKMWGTMAELHYRRSLPPFLKLEIARLARDAHSGNAKRDLLPLVVVAVITVVL